MRDAIAITANMTKSRRHPAGLYVLFFTEMWERFSYYGMRSLLVYYMIKHLQFTQERSSEIYGLYTGICLLHPALRRHARGPASWAAPNGDPGRSAYGYRTFPDGR